MEVKRLNLKNFRKYEELTLDFCPGVNVIAGENGQGKTSLLEAIFLCTCARSHKTAKDQELIRHEAKEYIVRLEYDQNRDYLESLEVAYFEALAGVPERSRNSRVIKHNEVRLDRLSEMMGLFNAVIFCPEDIMLVKEGPQGRRRFLDIVISQINRHYFSTLQSYSSVLSQRNKLLKIIKESGFSGEKTDSHLGMQLSVWNEQFTELAAEIIYQRLKYTAFLAEQAAEFHYNISSGKENLSLTYESLRGISNETDKTKIKELFHQRLLRVENEDIFRGSSSAGPHRDELLLELDGKSLKAFGSQGQQRTAVLSLKLAELQLLKRHSGQMPVLLLDDVLPELDESRRLSLVSNLQGAQVFISCTDVEEVHEKLRLLLEDKGSRSFKVTHEGVGMI